MRVVLVGAGNVATHLGLALKNAGHEIAQVYSRTSISSSALANLLETESCTSLDSLQAADLFVYSLTDNALEGVLSEMTQTAGIHVHTAASVDLSVFADRFENYGVFYPLQTFSKEKEINFKQVPVFVEANTAETTAFLKELASALTDKVYVAGSEQRIKLHVAAVFACNFTNYFYTIASEIIEKEGIPFDILKSLIEETASKINFLSPYEAQTGPARRNDTVTMEKHLGMIENENYNMLYRQISQLIADKYKC